MVTAPVDSPAGFPVEGTAADIREQTIDAALAALFANGPKSWTEVATELQRVLNGACVEGDWFDAKDRLHVTAAWTDSEEYLYSMPGAPAVDPVEQARREWVEASAVSSAAFERAVEARRKWKAAEKAAGDKR